MTQSPLRAASPPWFLRESGGFFVPCSLNGFLGCSVLVMIPLALIGLPALPVRR